MAGVGVRGWFRAAVDTADKGRFRAALGAADKGRCWGALPLSPCLAVPEPSGKAWLRHTSGYRGGAPPGRRTVPLG
jgi:hypothetical protein